MQENRSAISEGTKTPGRGDQVLVLKACYFDTLIQGKGIDAAPLFFRSKPCLCAYKLRSFTQRHRPIRRLIGLDLRAISKRP